MITSENYHKVIRVIADNQYHLSLEELEDLKEFIERIIDIQKSVQSIDEFTEEALNFFKVFYAKEELGLFNSDVDLKKEYSNPKLHQQFYDIHRIKEVDSIKWGWVYKELKK